MKQLKAGLLRSPGPLLLLPAQSQSAILRKKGEKQRINKQLWIPRFLKNQPTINGK
jgi:hypothetical protein